MGCDIHLISPMYKQHFCRSRPGRLGENPSSTTGSLWWLGHTPRPEFSFPAAVRMTKAKLGERAVTPSLIPPPFAISTQESAVFLRKAGFLPSSLTALLLLFADTIDVCRKHGYSVATTILVEYPTFSNDKTKKNFECFHHKNDK